MAQITYSADMDGDDYYAWKASKEGRAAQNLEYFIVSRAFPSTTPKKVVQGAFDAMGVVLGNVEFWSAGDILLAASPEVRAYALKHFA